MRVVGIDPGLAGCGYGVVEAEGARAEALAFGWWRTEAGARIELRLRELFLALIELLAEHEPDAVALEESFVGRDARVALSVGQVRGALLVACVKVGVPCVEYAPARVKQAVCGYGRADKAQVQRMAKALLGLEQVPTPTHAADALAVALGHADASALLRLAGVALRRSRIGLEGRVCVCEARGWDAAWILRPGRGGGVLLAPSAVAAGL